MKRLVVCCDGTWQKLTSECPTNVVKIAQAIKLVDDDKIPQLLFYSEGVGTGDLVDKFGGGAFGWGLDNVIQNAYRFLCLNYELDDQIYLFGFSRGAYIVRSLAGLIYNAGLLKRNHIRETSHAYALYRDRAENTKPSGAVSKNFRRNHSQKLPDNTFRPEITFLGCWDTVGSLGVPDQIPFLPVDNWINQKYEFHDTEINRRIKCARHAVAIDEKRRVFYVTPMLKSKDANDQDLKQVWFVGEHGCVGGGTEEYQKLSDITLQWMMHEAEKEGLSFQPDAMEYGLNPDPLTSFENTPQGIFEAFGVKIRKLSDEQDLDDQEYVYATLDDLHDSVKERWHLISTYRPEALKKLEGKIKLITPSMSS